MTEMTANDDVALPTQDQVRAYLDANPGFFQGHADLLGRLDPPLMQTGEKVVDLQRTMNERLRGDLDRLKAIQREMIAAGQANLSLIEQFHGAVLSLIHADDLDELVAAVETDLPRLLDIDAAGLLVEAADVPAAWLAHGIRPIAPGMAARWMGSDQTLLRPAAQDRVEVHGPNAAAVKSDALIRLPMEGGWPTVLLAVGVGRAEHFQPDHGTELLAFLAAVLARCIMRWAPAP